MRLELHKLGVTFTVGKGCACRGNPATYTYSIPVKIDAQIEEFLEPLGKSAMSFRKQSMFKVNNQDFAIIAVNRLKQIKLTIKNQEAISVKEQFEDLLINYIRKRKGS
jgi:hypothetical protein